MKWTDSFLVEKCNFGFLAIEGNERTLKTPEGMGECKIPTQRKIS